MILNTETVLFTPYQPLGFRIALFGFADFGLLGYSPNIFKNEFYTSFGIGIRLRNERLVFNTIQIRLGLALGKPDWSKANISGCRTPPAWNSTATGRHVPKSWTSNNRPQRPCKKRKRSR